MSWISLDTQWPCAVVWLILTAEDKIACVSAVCTTYGEVVDCNTTQWVRYVMSLNLFFGSSTGRACCGWATILRNRHVCVLHCSSAVKCHRLRPQSGKVGGQTTAQPFTWLKNIGMLVATLGMLVATLGMLVATLGMLVATLGMLVATLPNEYLSRAFTGTDDLVTW